MRLRDDWKDCWKWISVNCMFLAGSLQAAWMSLPDDLRAECPRNAVHMVTIAILVLGIIGRILKQGDKP